MSLGLIACLILGPMSGPRFQQEGALALPVTEGSSLGFALTNLQARGLRIDPGDVKLDRVRVKFEKPIRANSLEDLLFFTLAKCDPPLEFELIEQGNDVMGPLLRIKYADPKRTEPTGNFQFQAADHIRIVLERIKTVYTGYRLDTSAVDKEWSLFGEQADGTNNVLTRKYVGDTYEEFLANIFADVRPTLRAVKVGDKSYRVEIPFPLVGVQFGELDPDAKLAGTNKPRKLDDILKELAEKSGFEIKNQIYTHNPVRVPEQLAYSRRPLDEVLRHLAERSSPKLEILDLDPDTKKCRLVIAAAGGRPLVVPQPGHRGGITAIERSPSGDRLITEGNEGTINLWNMSDEKTLRSFIGRVAENAFTLDGQSAIVARNNTIARYSYVRQRPEVIFGTGAPVVALSFSPVKNWIWSGSSDGTVYVVNERNPEDRRYFTDPPGTKHVSTSRDGKQTAVWVADGTVLAIWDTSAVRAQDVVGNVVANVRVRGAIKAARFNADGTRLAVWHEPGAVSLFDQAGRPIQVRNGQYPNELVSYDDPQNPQATPFTFSPSGRTIAVATGNDQIGFFSSSDGRSMGQLNRIKETGAGSWVMSSVCWLRATPDSDGDEVVVGLDTTEIARDKDKLGVYSVASGQRLRLLEGTTFAVQGITFSRDGRVLIARDDYGFRRWDITMRIPPAYTPAGVVGVQTTNWLNRNESNNGVFVVGVANERPTLDERVLRPGAALLPKRPHAKRWFFGDNEAAYTYPLNVIDPAGVNAVIFSGDGQRIGWVAQNHVILGEVGELSPRRLAMPDGPIIAARLSGTGRFLVTVSGQARGVIRIWDLRPFFDGKDAVIWKTVQDGARNLVDERSIAVSKQRDVVAVSWGSETAVISIAGQAEASAAGMMRGRNPSLSDDGRFVAVQNQGRCEVSAIVIDGNFLRPVPVHTSPRNRFMPVLSPSGRQLVTFSQDRLEAYYQNWSISRGAEAKWDRHRAPINDVAFSSEGGMIATASQDGTIWLYGMKSEEIRVKNTGPVIADADRGGHPLVQLRGLDEDNFVVTDVYNQYWASKEASRLINFSASGQTFSYAQFDLILNRPHEIMKTIDYASAKKFALEQDIKLVESAVKIRLKTGSEASLPPIDDNFRFEAPATPLVQVEGDPKSGEVNLRVSLADPRASIVQWHVTVNGVPERLRNEGALRTDPQGGAAIETHRLKLLPGENTVRVWSVNEKSASSLAHEFRLSNPTTNLVPNLVVLAVGISNYANREYNLPAAAPDAKRLIESFRRFDRTQKDAYPNSPYAKVTLVHLPDATKDEILTAARQHLTGLRPQDHVIISLSGHGQIDNESEFQFLTKNYIATDGFGQALSYRELQQILKACGSRQMLVLIDACKAGAVPTFRQGVPGGQDEVKIEPSLAYSRSTAPALTPGALSALSMNYAFAYMKASFIDLENESGATVISAVTGSGYAYEIDAGFFGKAVREAFNPTSGADANKDGKLTVQELKAYVIERVPRIDGNRTLQLRQRPSVRQENLESDFAVYTYPVAAPPAKKPAPAKKPPVKKKGGG